MTVLSASLLGLGAATHDGRPWADATAAEWARAVRPVAEAGYRSVELPSTWLEVTELPAERTRELIAVLDDLGLTATGVLLARRSVIDPHDGLANLERTKRTIDAAADLGIGFVCTGLHAALPEEAARALWFWSQPGAPADPALWPTAVERIRDAAEHAATRGVRLSLELYERTFLGDVDSAARFVEAVDHPSCGINADLGNLQRAPEPVAGWETMLRRVLPHLDYWHIKNCMKVEDAARGTFSSWPVDLAAGVIDYRRAIAIARDAGFDGPIVVEHYGGDAIGAVARAHDYVRGLLAATEPRFRAR